MGVEIRRVDVLDAVRRARSWYANNFAEGVSLDDRIADAVLAAITASDLRAALGSCRNPECGRYQDHTGPCDPPTPPVAEADVAALAVVIADIVYPGAVPGSGVTANATSEGLARRLLATGRVAVTR